MGLRTFLFGKPNKKPTQATVKRQKQEREARKKNIVIKTSSREHGPSRDFPLMGGRESAVGRKELNNSRTFDEFMAICESIQLQEGTKKRAKRALKDYEKMRRKEHKTAQELYKETEAGSKERRKQITTHLLTQQGGGAISKRQKTLDKATEALRAHADKLERKKPHKVDKFKSKTMQRIQDIENRYTFNPNRKLNT